MKFLLLNCENYHDYISIYIKASLKKIKSRTHLIVTKWAVVCSYIKILVDDVVIDVAVATVVVFFFVSWGKQKNHYGYYYVKYFGM